MNWQISEEIQVDDKLCALLEKYRANYLDFFVERFRADHKPGYKGGYFNINSVSGLPYERHCCYSWTDGRSLGELAACYLHDLGDRENLQSYIEHLYQVLIERYELNGYFPHVVDDQTNLAADDPMNVKLAPGCSSFSHVFVLNGLFQYAMIFENETALELGNKLLQELGQALREDQFLEGSEPRPEGQRAQGPFMISLGACADILETISHLYDKQSPDFTRKSEPFIALGRYCIAHILANHHRAADHAFWEVNQDDKALQDDQGSVVTDPGHTIEFTGFAARFAAFLEPQERQSVLTTSLAVFLWAAEHGFHHTRNLIYKNIDRDTGRPIKNELLTDISQVVSASVFEEHFRGQSGPIRLATFPWWPPMELMAAAGILRHNDTTGQVDRLLLRAAKGIFEYYTNDRIGGLCYQNIGDEFFEYVDVPPATPTLDLMHSHRSLRVFLREVNKCGRG